MGFRVVNLAGCLPYAGFKVVKWRKVPCNTGFGVIPAELLAGVGFGECIVPEIQTGCGFPADGTWKRREGGSVVKCPTQIF